ncbi:MAG: YtxH domain-containing protein [Bacilli bacterium]
MSKKGFGKFALGAGLGAGLALLFAPKKGSDLRKDIKKKFDEFMHDVDKMTVEDVKKEFTTKVDEIKKGLEELDKEKVLKVAKKKSEELQKKAEELVKLAKDKGTSVLEGIAEDLRQKTISVAKEVVTKLEEK